MKTDQFLCLKTKAIIAKKVYFGSTRRGILKELYGIYKVFPLLNESGDPRFLFKNLSSLKLNKPVGEVWLKIYAQFYFRVISTQTLAHTQASSKYNFMPQNCYDDLSETAS